MSADVPVAFFDPGKNGRYRVPPCLRTPEERVEVEVRAIEVKAASGASGYLEILSVACPTR